MSNRYRQGKNHRFAAFDEKRYSSHFFLLADILEEAE